MIIQIKATEQYFPVVLLVLLYKVVLAFESMDQILSLTIWLKAKEHDFPEVVFIALQKVILIYESVDKVLSCDNVHSCDQLNGIQTKASKQ